MKFSDQSGTDRQLLSRLNNVNDEQSIEARGVGGDPILESVPQYIKTHSEKIIENNNSRIVLGRDRPASRLSGYGGIGATHCSSIDIVAGALGSEAKSYLNNGKRLWCDPDFKKDASRIYISQKSDVDDNFGLADGKVGNAKTKACIAIKSDGIRIIAREGIKLITKTDDKNSQGGDIRSISGIDIIAGNDDSDLQPMVKGNNLREALKKLTLHVDKLNGIVDSLLMAQMNMNEALTGHIHFSPFFGLPTTPSPPVLAAGMKTMVDHLTQTKVSLMTHKMNLSLFKISYFSPAGKHYICSRANNVN